MPALTRSEVAAYALCAVVVALLGMRALRAGPAPPPAPAPASPGAAASGVREDRSAGGREAVVHVVGAVRRPGIYELRAGARVDDAVRRAGGATSRAHLAGLNLAAKAADGTQIVVPERGAAVPVGGSGGPGGAPEAPISLSSATQEQLETLDGVGPVTATKIIEARTAGGGFGSIEDLADIPGIGPKRLEAIRERVQP